MTVQGKFIDMYPKAEEKFTDVYPKAEGSSGGWE